jgi:hypothetical protein
MRGESSGSGDGGTGGRLRRATAQASKSRQFVILSLVVWLGALLAIYFVWDARFLYKVLANIALLFTAPSVDDVVAAFRPRRATDSPDLPSSPPDDPP